jgi:CubicO group peptidase (beta-lactamase class C family)
MEVAMQYLLGVSERHTTRRKDVAGAAAMLVAGLGRKFLHAKAATMDNTQFSKVGMQRLHQDLAAYVAAGDRPGLVMLVSKSGETQVDAIGTHELGGGTPMRRDTIFRLASITRIYNRRCNDEVDRTGQTLSR